MLKRVLFLILSGLLFNLASGQDYLLKKENGIYYHQDKTYERDELELIYQDYPSCIELYERGYEKRSSALAVGLVGAGGIIGGVLLINVDGSDFLYPLLGGLSILA